MSPEDSGSAPGRRALGPVGLSFAGLYLSDHFGLCGYGALSAALQLLLFHFKPCTDRFRSPQSASDAAEGRFFDELETIAKVGGPNTSTILTTGGPLVGPAGVPAAALANAPLGIARNLSESGMEGAESTMPQSLQDQGFVE